MASPTKKLKVRRKLRAAKAGKSRKNRTKNNGSSQPNLPLNVPTANELAQKKSKS